MPVKRRLLGQLKKLDRLYNKAISNSLDPDLPRYFSRLAVLELSAWVEQEFDNLFLIYPRHRAVSDQKNVEYIKNKIEFNYGFSYKKNFVKLFCAIHGVFVFEYIEKNIDQSTLQKFRSAIETLYSDRCSHAHASVRTTASFKAPSVCISLFNDLYLGITEFESCLRSLRIHF